MRRIPTFARSSVLTTVALMVLGACTTATEPRSATDLITQGAVLSNGVGGTNMVPMKYRADFALVPNVLPVICSAPFNPPPVIGKRYVGTGNGTHLGKADIVIVFETCSYVGAGGVGLRVEGYADVTAANGDELHMTYTMALHPPGNLFDLDPINFDGGTGRFATAAGLASAAGSIDNTTHTGHFDLTGLITRPNH